MLLIQGVGVWWWGRRKQRSKLEDIKSIFEEFYQIGGVKVETTSIYKELFAGDTASVRITLSNTLSSPVKMTLGAEGDIKDFIFLEVLIYLLKPENLKR
jgi:hypothetical protein